MSMNIQTTFQTTLLVDWHSHFLTYFNNTSLNNIQMYRQRIFYTDNGGGGFIFWPFSILNPFWAMLHFIVTNTISQSDQLITDKLSFYILENANDLVMKVLCCGVSPFRIHGGICSI